MGFRSSNSEPARVGAVEAALSQASLMPDERAIAASATASADAENVKELNWDILKLEH